MKRLQGGGRQRSDGRVWTHSKGVPCKPRAVKGGAIGSRRRSSAEAQNL